MKNIKTFENFADDLLNQVGDENKEIQRPDLKGKPYEYKGLPKLPVVYAVEFVPAGTFNAFYNAENYLREMGYNTGSMEGVNPIGFSEKSNYISKWWNMTATEHKLLDGAMIPLGGFREGGVLVLFFDEPNL
jgi:hypothetical protein